MLTSSFDAPLSDSEWRDFLAGQDFGQLVVNGPGGEAPLVIPTHYWYDGDRVIECHLHRDNPVWAAFTAHGGALPVQADSRVLGARGEGVADAGAPLAVFAVVAAHVYVPTGWNAAPGHDPRWQAPTSYYAAVQAVGRAEIVDDHGELAAILMRQLARMQPEGGYAPVEPGPTPFGRMLRGIRGLRLEIEHVRARFKFGGNKSGEHRGMIADHLAMRDGPGDAAARAHLLRRRDALMDPPRGHG